jgi:hypothetical protein
LLHQTRSSLDGLADDELVVRRAAGVLAGPADERALGGDQSLAAANGLLVQRRHAEVPVHPRDVLDPVTFEPVACCCNCDILSSLGPSDATLDTHLGLIRLTKPDDRTGSAGGKSNVDA